MEKTSDINKELVSKYKVDDTILESYFKNAQNQYVKGMTFPLRIDNRQYCSPTDYQGSKPSCCGYSAAQILESLNWMKTGKVIQFDADQIYAKSKETDKQMGMAGTYPDLAMAKGLDLFPDGTKTYAVKSSTSKEVDELKRILHKNMFACVNMVVTKDLYDLDGTNFVYPGKGARAGGHSMVCCGYDEESQMLIMQNHWGKTWALKGFFLCPYNVWQRQTNITCWYERLDVQPEKKAKSSVALVKEEVKKPEPPKSPSPVVAPVKEQTKAEPTKVEQSPEVKAETKA